MAGCLPWEVAKAVAFATVLSDMAEHLGQVADAVGISKASWAVGRGNRQPDFESNLALFVSNAARTHILTHENVYSLDGVVSSPVR